MVEAIREPVVAQAEEARIFPEAAHFYIPSLDGIRAVAFLLVFVGHAGLGHLVPGGFGVTIFFFLSGYLITTLMRREAERSGRVSLKGFYTRRFLRIFPPFYLVLGVATLAMAIAHPSEIRPPAILAQLCQLSNYYMIAAGPLGIPPGMVVTWSLSVEEHFYLLFPLLYIILGKAFAPRGQAATLVALCGAILAWRCVLIYGLGANEWRTYSATDTRVDSILFGCILALHGNPMLDPPRFGLARPWARRVGFALGLVAVLATFVIRDPRFRETFRYTVQGLALIPIFDSAIRFPKALAFRILNVGWIRFLGVLSYSLYLLHHNFLILLEERTNWPKPATGVVALLISLALAYAIYRFVELPCARLRKRLSTAA